MAKTLFKDQQEKTREIVKRIFNLALDLNPTDTQRTITGEKPTAFVRFSGHVAGVEVEIYPCGWCNEEEPKSIRYMIYLDDEFFTGITDEYDPFAEPKECEPFSMAKAALAELQKIADKWGVDYV